MNNPVMFAAVCTLVGILVSSFVKFPNMVVSTSRGLVKMQQDIMDKVHAEMKAQKETHKKDIERIKEQLNTERLSGARIREEFSKLEERYFELHTENSELKAINALLMSLLPKEKQEQLKASQRVMATEERNRLSKANTRQVNTA
jgi:hypothetical protein